MNLPEGQLIGLPLVTVVVGSIQLEVQVNLQLGNHQTEVIELLLMALFLCFAAAFAHGGVG